ncbi:MAG: carboxypeptidase-like regulatory domain-containing protein [Butyricimonas faecihominis]
MKFVVLMVLLPVVTFAIPAYSQKQIKMDVQGVSLEQVLKELQVQSGYYILYNKQDVQGVKNVSLKVDGSSVKEVLELCLRNTSLQYAIEDQTILISLKKAGAEPEKKESVIIKGVVKDTKGSVLPGVTVIIKGTSVGTATGIDGNFSLNLVKQDTATLLFSFVGMKTKEVKWTGQSELNVVLEDER